ncbi:oligosaccharide flippase family protein [Aeromonas veronii]|uniref:lipopolysaccharide biosynthesis protein n=1 Tax=Aeromonas veronii TaxID=654 RepID=UPI0021634230|nr:oligosaccharide flippase family protein [Aeromonas veronii]
MHFLNKLFNRKNNLYYILGSIVSGVISIVTIPSLTWIYQVEVIGVYALFVVLVGLLSTLFSLAVDQYVIRHYYHLDKSLVLSKALFLSFISTIIVTLLLSCFYSIISRFIYGEVSVLGYGILLLCSISNMLFKYTSLILRMEREAFYFAISQVMQRLTIIALSLLYYFLTDNRDNGWLTIVIIHTFSVFIVVLSQVFLIKKNKVFCIKMPSVEWGEECKGILKYSLPLLMSTLILWGMGSIDKIFLKMFSTARDLGLYSNAYKFAAALILFQQMISVIWVPTSMRWYKEKKDISEYRCVFNLIVAATLFSYVIFSLLSPFLKFVIQESYYPSLKLIPIIMLYPSFYLFSEFTVIGLLFSSRTNYSINISVFTIIVCVASCYVLTKQFGMLGTSISIATSYIIFFILRTYYSVFVWENILSTSSVLGMIVLLCASFIFYNDWYVGPVSLLIIIFSGFLGYSNRKVLIKK